MTRRLSVGWSLKNTGAGAAPASPLPNLLGENDDAAEREALRNRRKSNMLKAAVSSPYKGSPAGANKENTPVKTTSRASKKRISDRRKSLFKKKSHAGDALTNTQLADLYSSCMKMSMENKINQKNSWDLNLIDYIDDVLNGDEDDISTNFQRASVTIDAASKIYGSRVDSLEADTYRILGGLSRNRSDDPADESDGEGGEGEGRRKKKRGNAVTLESSFNALRVSKVDCVWDVDPLFSKTSAAFDEGGARGLLLNHLFVHRGCEVIFDSTDAVMDTAGSSAPASTSETMYDLSLFNNTLPSTKDIGRSQVCPEFRAFAAHHWSPEALAVPLSELANNNNNANMGGDGGVGNDSGYFDNDDDDFSDGGIDIDADMVFGEQNGDSSATRWEEARLAEAAAKLSGPSTGNTEDDRRRAVTTEVVLALAAAGNPLFAHTSKHKSWAGPEHWKFKKTSTKSDGDSGNNKKRKKKEKFFLDFTKAEAVDVESAFGESRAATTLSEATLARGGSTTLPKDVKYKPEDLSRLFLRPAFCVRCRPVREAVTSDTGDMREWYDYDNANDAENFCPAVETTTADGIFGGNAGGWSDDDDDDGFGMFDGGAGVGGGVGLSLVDEPQKVAKIDIKYARVAKKVDVKALKANLWEQLRGEKPRKEDKMPEEPTSFADTVQELPKRLPSTLAQNVSVPFCFICLLHLANEKGLSISNAGNLDDLIVAQDPTVTEPAV